MKTPKKTTSKEQHKSTKPKSSSLLTGSIIVVLIAATPYLFYLYKSFPADKIWETFLFTYQTNLFPDVQTFAWTLFGKLIPLFLLTIWFLTCKHWWYHVILIPIGMYLFQLISSLNDDLRYLDVVEFWYVFPIMAVIVPLVYLIRAKLLSKMRASEDLEKYERELFENKNFFQQLRDLFR